jgi:hypothetical protein
MGVIGGTAMLFLSIPALIATGLLVGIIAWRERAPPAEVWAVRWRGVFLVM